MNTSNFANHKALQWIFLLLLLVDLSYSFYQYLQAPLDGDIAPIVLPSDWYRPVMSDPFGWTVLTEGKSYAATNRYFTHWSISNWLKHTPRWLQRWMDPVQSVYWSCAIFKLLVHVLLLYLLAALISARSYPFLDRRFLFVAVLLAPCFQTYGYAAYIGIISPSIIYTFFYAFPMALLLWWLLPFLQALQHREGWGSLQLSIGRKLVAALLLVFLAFNGPLVQPVVLLMLPTLLLLQFWRLWQQTSASAFGVRIKATLMAFPRLPLFYFTAFILCTLYSFYIGTFNAENATTKSLAERFALLPQGIFRLFTEKLGASLLLAAILVNSYLLHRLRSEEAQQLLGVFRWILFLSIAYILLLPLGGYRAYRPFILRADTFLPVTLGMLYAFGSSALLLLQQLDLKKRKFYALGVIVVALIFTLADESGQGHNHCEQTALYKIAAAKTEIVELQTDCLIMSWGPITAPRESELNSRLLHYWQLTDKPRLYFQNIIPQSE